MEQARGDGKPHSAQDTLPFRQMYPDGLCKLDDATWSRCIEFADVNYQLAQPDDQTAIFEALCDMYNAHDSSIGMEITLPCRHMNREDFVKRIEIAAQGDDFDDLRELYTQMLRRQLEQGNNGLVKSKLLILTLEANDIHSARAKFSRIMLDALNHFKTMGALAKALDGREWLELLHGILHPDGERFSFDWDWLAPSGLHVKDFIAPSSFRFGAARRFQMGTKYCAASFLQITAPEMDDRILAELLDTDSDLLLSIHVRSMDQNEAIKTVKRKITDIDSMKIDAQKRAAREGFDMDIIPTDIATYAGEAKNILRDLQSRNERMFLVTFLLVNMADSKRKLDNDITRASSVAQKYNCQLTRLDFQQEQGFVSALPLGVNQIKIQRGLTTSALAIMMPFTTQEIFQGGDALYYGLNATSGNMILADRKQNKTPNGLILGTPGSGKSFSAKRSILNVFLITRDDIIICDPEAEYFPLVHRLHGQVIKISPTSRHHVNPMDINLNYSEDDNPLALKSDFILSFCELAAGGRSGLEPVEKTVIDRAVRSVYRPYIADPKPENMPILEDLYDEIKRQPEPEAQRVAAALELYVHGSLNVFNHRTNVDINNRLVCFDIKELGKQLKNLGMLVIQDQVWNRVSQNRDIGKSTWYFVDEFHLLLRGEVGAWSVEIWKRFRKWGGIPTGITQNVKDLLASPEIENIFENSDFIYLLNQASGDRKILCERLNISSKQAGHISNSAPGEGLIVFGNIILPFKDHFPRDNELYDIMTTKPGEVANLKIEQEG
ncbi:MAG: ATP-binding protein [Oscillospiraceae bacterium]|nr:ATP-binding protein [Oscillospiraceae bacterium]